SQASTVRGSGRRTGGRSVTAPSLRVGYDTFLVPARLTRSRGSWVTAGPGGRRAGRRPVGNQMADPGVISMARHPAAGLPAGHPGKGGGLMQWIVAILAIVAALAVISFIVAALKWLLIIAVVVALVGAVRAIAGGRRNQLRR